MHFMAKGQQGQGRQRRWHKCGQSLHRQHGQGPAGPGKAAQMAQIEQALAPLTASTDLRAEPSVWRALTNPFFVRPSPTGTLLQ
jgi:hypothetical protein